MPRIDIWDVQAAKKEPAIDCGFPRDLDTHFEWGRVLGKGGFGLVRTVTEKKSGIEFACKTVSKTLDIPNLSHQKLAQHIDNVKREIKILTRLRGTLSVVHFKGAYEDDQNIHMVMEYCRGGELVHEIGRRPYTEKTVAGYMRSVLHTLAQCHSHRILHRDIKPGNFMLLTADEDSPLKAIDFGLAVFYDPDKLPRTDLGLEGTPWFMAPETLSSETYPASDVWAAGVMAYQLLSGYLPFDDPRNPNAPALSTIWKGILTEQPSFRRSAWKEVSEEAKDFVRTLLDKDHSKRPSAKEALRHPWLSPAFHEAKQRPISATVVQRIQRFAQTNVLRRTILELIAQELLKMMPALSPTVHGPGEFGSYLQQQQQQPGEGSDLSSPLAGAASEGNLDIFPMSPIEGGGLAIAGAQFGSPPFSPGADPDMGRSASINVAELARARQRASMDSAGGSGHGGDSFRAGMLARMASRGSGSGSVHGGRLFRRSPSTQQLALLARGSERQRGSASVHGPGDYFRVMRQASELAAMESGHGQTDYLRVAPRTEEERTAARKAARLSLDTSAHGGDDFQKLLQQLEHKRKVAAVRATKSSGSLPTGWQPQQGAAAGTGTAAGAAAAAAAAEAPALGLPPPAPQRPAGAGPAGWPALASQPAGPSPLAPIAERAAAAESDGERGAGAPVTAEERGRGRGAAKALLQSMLSQPGGGGSSSQHAASGAGGLPPLPESHAAQLPPDVPAPSSGEAAPRMSKRVSFGGMEMLGEGGGGGGGGLASSSQQGPSGAGPMALDLGPALLQPPQQAQQQAQQAQQQPGQQQQQGQTLAAFSAAAVAAAQAGTGAGSGGGSSGSGGKGAVGAVTNPRDLEQLMRRMHFRSNKGLGPEDMSEGLRQLGYDLEPSEVAILMQQLDLNADGQVHAPEFVASQMDWAALQESNRELWLECARRAFEGLNAGSDGLLSVDSLIGVLRQKLPAAEVDYAVEDALMEAGYADADDVDFDGFLRMLKVGSYDSLDALEQYDSRYGGSLRGGHSMDTEGSQHLRLASVPEEQQTPRLGQ